MKRVTGRKTHVLLFVLFVLFSGLMAAHSVSAATVKEYGSCGPELTYTLYSNGLLEITGKGEMTLSPWKKSAYNEDEFITEVRLPEGLTKLCNEAFSGCFALVKISLPESLKAIPFQTFWRCKALKSITIPAGVKDVGSYAFLACESLERLTVKARQISFGFGVFSGCPSLSKVELCEGMTEIAYDMFSRCSSLKDITIPDSVTYIAEYAFSKCTALEIVEIPKNVTTIMPSAFWECTNLTKIVIPKNVTVIRQNAFKACDKLTIYGYAGSVAETYALENNIPFIPLDPEPIAVTGVKLDKTSTKMLTSTSTLLPGQSDASLTLKATVLPADADNKKVKWSTSDKSVATVDASGKVKGLKAGTVTITATTEDGGKTASCKIQVMTRKEIALKAGSKYVFKSKLSNNYSMDVMYQNYATNTNVSLYTTTAKRGAQILTVEKKVVNGKTCWLLTRKNSTVGSRAVTELKGKNLVFGTNKYTNWQLFRAYQFNDGTVQFINRGSNNAIAVVGGVAANRANVAPAKADLGNGQRWKCVVVG